MLALSYISFISYANNDGIAEISARNSQHTCVLFKNGEVRCFGRNDNGQVGGGLDTNLGDDPTEIATLAPRTFLATDTQPVSAVYAFASTSCGTLSL